ncbi:winged helix-turn-helix domain-containing protein [Paenibacillus solisilvae]|uniref:Winged helix-turn-helix domain-containing protein n=1 Tax=Paenibacillus solisilvae TaxID=2486751 RepID=A0ABW0VQ89_9BACL
MEWNPGRLSASYKGLTITFLPKEYALFSFLYEHAGQSFTREQLLNAVWPMENPVDRTVDDHIYRLRKKAARFAPAVQIETVRSVGYRLVAANGSEEANPLRHSASFSSELQHIADTYLKYGRGDALLMLSQNKDVLGYEAGPASQILYRFMEGDIRFIVDEEPYSFADRAFFLLFLNQLIDPLQNRKFVEAAVTHQLLPGPWQNELSAMSIISFSLDWGDYKQALDKLTALSAEAEEHCWEGLLPYTANLKLEYAMHGSDRAAIEESILHAEKLLERYPYQREEGQYWLLRGIAIYVDDPRQGLSWLNQGLELLRKSQFILNLMRGIAMAKGFSKRHDWDKAYAMLEAEWEKLSKRTGMKSIEERIPQQLQMHLGSL